MRPSNRGVLFAERTLPCSTRASPLCWRGDLPDDPSVSWKVQLVTDLILSHVKEHRIDLMLSFDQRGVSGHANHVAIYQAFRYIYTHKLTPTGCRMLCLHSVTLLRKYSSLLELPLALFQPHVLLCLARCSQYRRALRAMVCHRSQMLWFRWLYLLFSRYMFVNTFWDISKTELEPAGATLHSR
uniref:N-acetylglucosaminyl-phosphatidylinositol de-N-acetylase isoform X2 n=1 Tax=Myxine glutinosa TaxID=7769 RepID=UPI0035902526